MGSNVELVQNRYTAVCNKSCILWKPVGRTGAPHWAVRQLDYSLPFALTRWWFSKSVAICFVKASNAFLTKCGCALTLPVCRHGQSASVGSVERLGQTHNVTEHVPAAKTRERIQQLQQRLEPCCICLSISNNSLSKFNMIDLNGFVQVRTNISKLCVLHKCPPLQQKKVSTG